MSNLKIETHYKKRVHLQNYLDELESILRKFIIFPEYLTWTLKNYDELHYDTSDAVSNSNICEFFSDSENLDKIIELTNLNKSYGYTFYKSEEFIGITELGYLI